MQTNKKFKLSSTLITLTVVAVLYVLMILAVNLGFLNRSMTVLLVPISYYIVLAVSLNLVVGLLGELSLGHAGFMSVGAYGGAILSTALSEMIPQVWIRLPLCMIFGGLVAAVVGFVVGLPALRLRGDYLAIVTLACGEIIKDVITNLKFTGGAIGYYTDSIMVSSVGELLPYAGVLVLITVAVMLNLKKSRHGRAIMAIRDNRIAAEAMGINITYYKLMVFVLAAFFAGCAGVLYAHNLSQIQAAKFGFNFSIEILVIVVLGGMGSVTGSIVAAVVLQLLPQVLREFDKYRMLIYSVVLIVVMILNANPKFNAWKGKLTWSNLFKKKKKEATDHE